MAEKTTETQIEQLQKTVDGMNKIIIALTRRNRQLENQVHQMQMNMNQVQAALNRILRQ